jgi:hypothetical protein
VQQIQACHQDSIASREEENLTAQEQELSIGTHDELSW